MGIAEEEQREPSFEDFLGAVSSFSEEERRVWEGSYVEKDSEYIFEEFYQSDESQGMLFYIRYSKKEEANGYAWEWEGCVPVYAFWVKDKLHYFGFAEGATNFEKRCDRE